MSQLSTIMAPVTLSGVTKNLPLNVCVCAFKLTYYFQLKCPLNFLIWLLLGLSLKFIRIINVGKF